MSRVKFVAVLVTLGLAAILVPVALVLAQGGDGTVTIRDSDPTDYSGTLSDMAMIALSDIPPAPDGTVYEGWFVSDDGSRKVSTGLLDVDADGNVSHTFSIPAPPMMITINTGESLFAAFDKFVVTVEPVPDPEPDAPSDVAAFIGQLDSAALAHIRHLTYSLSGYPAYLSGPHQGEPKGLTVGLREQTNVAFVHSGLSANSVTLAAISQHSEHVVNIIEGTGDRGGPNFGDLDGNGQAQNPAPSDGFGVLNYAADAKAHAQFAMSAAPGDQTVQMNGQMVADAADRVTLWAMQARDLSLLAAGSSSLTSATLFAGNSRTAMEKAWSAAMDAYMSAQDMGMYTIEAIPAPVDPVEICDNNVDDDGDGMVDTDDPDCPKPPDTGDPIVPNAAFAVLLLGAVLLGSGAYVWRRSRHSA